MNMTKSNYVKIQSSKPSFTNDLKSERKEKHKHLQQDRRSARYNKQFIKSL